MTMPIAEQAARLIEPFYWRQFDNALRPYAESRGAYSALNESQLYGLGVVVGGAIPSRHIYTDPEGEEEEVKSAVSFGNYFFVGLELQALFGNVEKD